LKKKDEEIDNYELYFEYGEYFQYRMN